MFSPGGTPGRMSGAGYKRRRTINNIAAYMRGYRTTTKRPASKIYRSLGLPSRVHDFKRCGTVFAVTNTGGLGMQVNGVANGSVPQGLVLANYSAGNVANTMKFGGAFNFKLSNVATASEITQLFDNYRIAGVQLRIDYTFNAAPGQAALGGNAFSSNALPTMYSVIDYDDATPPTAITDVLENSTCRVSRLDDALLLSCAPRAQAAVSANSGIVQGGQLSKTVWLDNNATDIPHYGVKFWIENIPLAPVAFDYALMITPIYYLQAKNVV